MGRPVLVVDGVSDEEFAVTDRRSWPKVSCIIPVRDDARALPRAVASILTQDYPGELEIIIAQAPSRDDTAEVARDLAASDPRIAVITNPRGSTPAGLNRAIACATGSVIARVDARSELSPEYVTTAVEILRETGADNVGGTQAARGTTPFTRAVALAMTTWFGVGDARFHVGGDAGPVDTVYLGVFQRSSLDRVGGFDELLIRNQDYELNYRLRAAGGTVYYDPRLQVHYEPRGTLRALAQQYFDYGRWKQVVVRRHPRSLRWRQVVPPATVLANATGIALASAGYRRALIIPATYLAATIGATLLACRGRGRSREALLLPSIFVTMHHAWGFGFLVGRRATEDGRPPPAAGEGEVAP